MLDTNVCIRVLRDRPRGLRERFNAEATARSVSSIVVYELFVGAEKSANSVEIRQEVERFLSRVEVLQFEPAAAQAAEIRATLERRGSPIGPHDTLIAGRARSRGLMVIAGDLGEFSRVNGLRSEDWLSSPPTR